MDNYATWLDKTTTQLQEAIEAAEEDGWHHLEASPDTRARIQIYDRLLTWYAEVTTRRRFYDAVKATRRP